MRETGEYSTKHYSDLPQWILVIFAIVATIVSLLQSAHGQEQVQQAEEQQIDQQVLQQQVPIQQLQIDAKNQLPNNVLFNQQFIGRGNFRGNSRPIEGRMAAHLDHRTIRDMIDRGCDFIRSTQAENGSFGGRETALGALALLAAGADPKGDHALVRALSYLEANKDIDQTYVHGITANVWEYALRRYPDDKTYRELLMHDAKWLMEALGKKTGWRYSKTSTDWDNSVTQYGVLGIWAACRGGFDPGKAFWRARADHFLKHQNSNGGWGYTAGAGSTANMATAGLATQFLVYDKLFSGDCYRPGQDDPFASKEAKEIWNSLERGMGWLGEAAAGMQGQSFGGYYNYGIERVGVASGRQTMGGMDWFRQGAEPLLRLQNDNGSFNTHGHGGAIAQAAFNVLFLVYGGAPVAFNKLQYCEGPEWNRNPRDLATLTGSLWSAYERPLNWQSVELEDDPTGWEGAILFITGDKELSFTPAQIEKLKTYIDRGGTILAEPLPDAEAFRASMIQLAGKLIPDGASAGELKKLGSDHPLYTCMPQKWNERPRFSGLSDGARTVFFLSDNYLSGDWQSGKVEENDDAYKIALNLLSYVYDLGSPRPRYAATLPECEPAKMKERKCLVYRMVPRNADVGDFLRAMNVSSTEEFIRHATGLELDIHSGPLTATDTDAARPDIIRLSGIQRFTLTKADKAALKTCVGQGSIILADAYASSPEFIRSCKKELTALFGEFEPLSSDNHLAAGTFSGGEDLYDLRYNLVARRELKDRGLRPRGQCLETIMVDGRPAVLFSSIDLTSALAGVRNYRSASYKPESARRLLANIVAYACAD